MPEPFAMVETRILRASIWREDSDTRIVWFTLLILVNLQDGTVMSSVPGLADVAKVSLENTIKALEKFKSPDKWSSNDAHEGRRIEEIPGGWRLLNYEAIRKAHQKDRKNTYMRGYMQERRAEVPVPFEPPAEGTESELPDAIGNGAIPTFEEVKAYGAKAGVSFESSKKFFDYHENKNLWLNKYGRLINWQKGLVAWGAQDRTYGTNQRPGNAGTKPATKITGSEPNNGF